jgi:hypothetical protein
MIAYNYPIIANLPYTFKINKSEVRHCLFSLGRLTMRVAQSAQQDCPENYILSSLPSSFASVGLAWSVRQTPFASEPIDSHSDIVTQGMD